MEREKERERERETEAGSFLAFNDGARRLFQEFPFPGNSQFPAFFRSRELSSIPISQFPTFRHGTQP